MREALLCMATVAGLLVAAAASGADDVQEQLRQVQVRMADLEERLRAATDQLESSNARLARQQEVIDRSGIAEQRPASSGLAAFLDTLEIGGWVSGSYFYNFEDPDGSVLGGFNSGNVAGLPFKPDANSFSFDQLWFELERPIDEENRAGFRADLVYGKTAGLLSGVTSGDGLSGNDLAVYQAYAQYLAPIGSGVSFQFGKFATLLGAEVVQAPYNFNITRGHVYNLFQPVTHTGILASMEMAEGTSLSLGLVNETRSFPAADIDLNKDKAVLGSLAWSGDGLSASVAGVYGASDSGQGANTPAGDKELILDLILAWDPSEKLSTYLNADYIDSENSCFDDPFTPCGGGEFDGYGVAVAGRYALSERLGLALRGEYVDLEFDGGSGGSDSDLTVWGITGTLDYSLTDRLMVRGELRYDDAGSSDGAFDEPFFDEEAIPTEDDQVTAGVEVIYKF